MRRFDDRPVFTAGAFRAFEIDAARIPMLQQFYQSNPEYHLAVNGEPPGPTEARDEFESLPPAGWPYKKRWVLGFFDAQESMIGVANVISDLFAAGIWHVGLFIVATRFHGSGVAQILYAQLESWMRGNGALWLRLGVVEGNVRAERFWERSGYLDIRKRQGVEMGKRLNTLRVMAKPLAADGVSEYLAVVERDRSESP
jgi:GNAT superfamily N-acetyltransferase